MAFGAARACYDAECRFYSDDTEATTDNRIIWYFVPDERPVFEGTNVFWPRSDTPPEEADSVFEAEGKGNAVRHHTNGLDVYHFFGEHVHGDPEDFAGLAPRSKYWIDGEPPVEPCPLVPISGLRLGLRFQTLTPPATCLMLAGDNPTLTLKLTSADYPLIDGLSFQLSWSVVRWFGNFLGDDAQVGFSLNCADSPAPGTLGGYMVYYDATIPPDRGDQAFPFLWSPLSYDPFHLVATAETYQGLPPVLSGKHITFEIWGSAYLSNSRLALQFETVTPSPTLGNFVLLEDGSGHLLLEDGSALLLETTVIDVGGFLLEDGTGHLLQENGSLLLLEASSPGLLLEDGSGHLLLEDGGTLLLEVIVSAGMLLEDGSGHLLLESGDVLLIEDALGGELLLEDGTHLLTESGDSLLLESPTPSDGMLLEDGSGHLLLESGGMLLL